ncbi:MAG: alpha/beta hydrolase [Clostridia bacterium]|nr:alpha/beta hydrolase [Clostridia bacterium]
MVKREEFSYDSRDMISSIHAFRWVPQDMEIRFIVQIIHGKTESLERYNEFATFLAQKGILVVGNDHLGHGTTAAKSEDKGYFCKNDGATVLVRDVHRLKKMTQEQYPGKQYFIIGHSMGSYILRNYLCRYGTGIDGAIICGTGSRNQFQVKAEKALITILMWLKGDHAISKMIEHMAFSSFNRRIDHRRTDADWLSKDQEVVDQYCNNEQYQYTFTLNGYKVLADLIDNSQSKRYLVNMPKELPILFASGTEDPVGNYGKGVRKAYHLFEQIGMKQISLKLYEGDRHEILNETDRAVVYEDFLNWIESHVTK